MRKQPSKKWKAATGFWFPITTDAAPRLRFSWSPALSANISSRFDNLLSKFSIFIERLSELNEPSSHFSVQLQPLVPRVPESSPSACGTEQLLPLFFCPVPPALVGVERAGYTLPCPAPAASPSGHCETHRKIQVRDFPESSPSACRD
jgi:hypothetical protein